MMMMMVMVDGGTSHATSPPPSATDKSGSLVEEEQLCGRMKQVWHGTAQPQLTYARTKGGISFSATCVRDARLLIAILGIGRQLQEHLMLAKKNR